MKKLIGAVVIALLMLNQIAFAQNNKEIEILDDNYQPGADAIIIDGRPQDVFKSSFISGAINIMEAKFQEFLPKIISSDTEFYLVADNSERLETLIGKTKAAGYAQNVKGAFVYDRQDGESMPEFDKEYFIDNKDEFTIIDIRTPMEFLSEPIFEEALNFPLQDLKHQADQIPINRPIVVLCATGYRSAIGSSIIHNAIPHQDVYDMSGAVKEFAKNN